MATSRRLFKNIADRYKRLRPSPETDVRTSDYEARYGQWNIMVHATADALKDEAPSFDRRRFLEACGVEF